MQTETKNNREIGYDFIRFFAMIFILGYHFFTTCIANKINFPFLLKTIIAHGSISWGG